MNEQSIAAQAARWVGTLARGGAQEHAAFAAWLRASPQHVKEYLLATAVEKEIDGLELGDIDVAQVLKNADGNVLPLGSPLTLALGNLLLHCSTDRIHAVVSPWKGERGRYRWTAGIAATLFVAIASWYWLGPGAWQTYSTGIGEQRAFELEDGSIVELNPLSQARVKLSAKARDIELKQGEAMFSVERDPVRPFRVYSGDTVVRAVGTQFTVHRRAGSVTVSVIEGRVEVRRDSDPLPLPSPILSAGEQIKLVAGESAITRRSVEAGQTNSWRQRSLTFSGDALGDIVEDFNRYNRSPRIVIEGKALKTRQFSGVFNVDDPDSLIDYLSQDERLMFERRDGKVIVRER